MHGEKNDAWGGEIILQGIISRRKLFRVFPLVGMRSVLFEDNSGHGLTPGGGFCPGIVSRLKYTQLSGEIVEKRVSGESIAQLLEVDVQQVVLRDDYPGEVSPEYGSQIIQHLSEVGGNLEYRCGKITSI